MLQDGLLRMVTTHAVQQAVPQAALCVLLVRAGLAGSGAVVRPGHAVLGPGLVAVRMHILQQETVCYHGLL